MLLFVQRQNYRRRYILLGYCDSDVTLCLLFWNMLIVQDRDVKFHISDIDIIKSIVQILAFFCLFNFFSLFFLFFFSSSSFCLCMC